MADFLNATAKVPSSFAFDGRRVRPGDHFTSDSPRMTRTLLDIGFAELAEDSSWNIGAKVISEPNTSNVAATFVVDVPRKRGRPKGYKRRDMQAED
jgi:hypothetical protein